MTGLSRRSVLKAAGLGTTGLIVSCADPSQRADPPGPTPSPVRGPAAPTAPAPGGTGSTTGGGSPGAGPSCGLPSPHTPAAPSREQIVARYAAAAPSVFGLDAPGVVLRLPTRDRVIALTFDACGGATPAGAGSGYDHALIEVLRRAGVRATLFLCARWVAAHPGALTELAAQSWLQIANHGTRHLPLSVDGRAAYGLAGTGNPGEVYDEIMGNDTLAHCPSARFFRPGTAHSDDVAVRIAADLGYRVVGFSVNGDEGATLPAATIARRLATAQAGDIVISHMNHPQRDTAQGYARGLPALLARGLRPVTLGEYLD